MNLNTFSIKIRPTLGSDLEGIVVEAIRLSRQLDCLIEFDFNDTFICVNHRSTSIEKVLHQYNHDLRGRKKQQILEHENQISQPKEDE